MEDNNNDWISKWTGGYNWNKNSNSTHNNDNNDNDNKKNYLTDSKNNSYNGEDIGASIARELQKQQYIQQQKQIQANKNVLKISICLSLIIIALLFIFVSCIQENSKAKTETQYQFIEEPAYSIEYNSYLGYWVIIEGSVKNTSGKLSDIYLSFYVYSGNKMLDFVYVNLYNVLNNETRTIYKTSDYFSEKPTRITLEHASVL